MSASAAQARQLITACAATVEEFAKLVRKPVARYISRHQLYGHG